MKVKFESFKVLTVAAAVLSVLGTQAALADSYYIENTEIVGPVSAQQQETVREYVRSSIAGRAGDEVVSSRDRADFVVQPKLIRDGSRYTIVMDKLSGDQVVWSGRTDPIVEENVDTNINRLVRAMAEEMGEGERVADITVITSASVERGRQSSGQVERDVTDVREIPPRQFFLGFGPAFLPDVIDASGDPQLGLNFAYNWDQDYAIINLFADLTFIGSSVGVIGGGMGVNYLLMPERDATPFLGAQLGYGAVFPETGPDDSVGGFLVNGVIGTQLFRRSSVNMELSFRFGWFTSEIAGETPFMSALLVGIHFGGDA